MTISTFSQTSTNGSITYLSLRQLLSKWTPADGNRGGPHEDYQYLTTDHAIRDRGEDVILDTTDTASKQPGLKSGCPR